MPSSDIYSSFIVSPSPDVIYSSGVIFTTAILPNDTVTMLFVSGYQGKRARKLTQGPVLKQKEKSVLTFYPDSLTIITRGMDK